LDGTLEKIRNKSWQVFKLRTEAFECLSGWKVLH